MNKNKCTNIFQKDDCVNECAWLGDSELKTKVLQRMGLQKTVKKNNGLCVDKDTVSCQIIKDKAACERFPDQCKINNKGKCKPDLGSPDQVKSDEKDYENYDVELGACRPSSKIGPNHWENKGYRSIDDCKELCDKNEKCKGFDVSRPKDGKYHCFLHFGNDMKGNPNAPRCGFKDDCSCYLKSVEPDYVASDGACRPSQATGELAWKNLDYMDANQCKRLCDRDTKCKGYELARESNGEFNCYKHYNDNMEGQLVDNCKTPGQCTCFVRSDTALSKSAEPVQPPAQAKVQSTPEQAISDLVSMTFSGYTESDGACRPSTGWKRIDGLGAGQCKARCDGDSSCKGFELARGVNGKYECHLHYNNNMKGEYVGDCLTPGRCRCFVKDSAVDSSVGGSEFNFSGYSKSDGACRPSTGWKRTDGLNAEQCKVSCDNDSQCTGFELARGVNGLYQCHRHYNDNMSGQYVGDCMTPGRCTCFTKN